MSTITKWDRPASNRTVEAPEATAALPVDLIGIDLGVANIAFDSDGNNYSGTHLNKVRHQHHALRGKLQKKGTKSAKRLLKKRRRKERSFATNVNHVISKSVERLWGEVLRLAKIRHRPCTNLGW